MICKISHISQPKFCSVRLLNYIFIGILIWIDVYLVYVPSPFNDLFCRYIYRCIHNSREHYMKFEIFRSIFWYWIFYLKLFFNFPLLKLNQEIPLTVTFMNFSYILILIKGLQKSLKWWLNNVVKISDIIFNTC